MNMDLVYSIVAMLIMWGLGYMTCRDSKEDDEND